MRMLFVTNFCPHYRVRTFETLARRADVRFVFFSRGDEWYWGQLHGRETGNFPHRYLRGFQVTRWVRVTPGLIPLLWRYDGDVILKCITGRFALPVSLLVAKFRRKPFVLWTGIWRHPRTLFHVLTYPVTRLVYALADAIVVYGDHVKRYLVSLGVPGEKIFVAYHAVDNAAYRREVPDDEQHALRAELRVGSHPVLLYVGRLETSKGVDDLIEAFSRVAVPEVRLVLVGTGDRRSDLEALARERGVGERVVFAGYQSPERTVAFYAIAEALVLPSVSVAAGSEPWGLVVNEAMNQGVPVVASTAVGAAQGGLVQDGVNGLIVPERNPVRLAGALARILTDRRFHERAGRAARTAVAQWDNMRMTEGFLAAAEYALRRRNGA